MESFKGKVKDILKMQGLIQSNKIKSLVQDDKDIMKLRALAFAIKIVHYAE